MQIEIVKTENVKEYKNNPRNNDNAVKYVANSIKAFGFKIPIIIDQDNVIVCGHTRLKAAKSLGLESVPCIRADDLTARQIKAFRIADNKTAEMSSWDVALLDTEIDDLIDFDMSDFGFNFTPANEGDNIAEANFDETIDKDWEKYNQVVISYHDDDALVLADFLGIKNMNAVSLFFDGNKKRLIENEAM